MRVMAFSHTTPQFIDGTKDVTRRFSWLDLKPGTRLMAVEKSPGLRKGEKVRRLGEIEIVSVRSENINAMVNDIDYGRDELRREGYSFGCTLPAAFVAELRKIGKWGRYVNRIEFRKIENNGNNKAFMLE